MKTKTFNKADYNPRKMSKEAKLGLAKSIEEFQDISGIVINSRTNNILAGNHRWETLFKNNPKDSLTLTHIFGEFYSLDNIIDNKPTGFLVRVVDWDIEKEKAANVTANNTLIQGVFTEGLQDVLASITMYSDEMFDALKMSDLMMDMDSISDDDWYDDHDGSSEETKVKAEITKNKSEKRSKKDDEDIAPVKEILKTMKIRVPGEVFEEFLAEVNSIIDSNEMFKDKITIDL